VANQDRDSDLTLRTRLPTRGSHSQLVQPASQMACRLARRRGPLALLERGLGRAPGSVEAPEFGVPIGRINRLRVDIWPRGQHSSMSVYPVLTSRYPGFWLRGGFGSTERVRRTSAVGSLSRPAACGRNVALYRELSCLDQAPKVNCTSGWDTPGGLSQPGTTTLLYAGITRLVPTTAPSEHAASGKLLGTIQKPEHEGTLKSRTAD
jgi:hypothetical protein